MNKNRKLQRFQSMIRDAASYGQQQIDALRLLWDLADETENKRILCEPSLNLLPTMKTLMETNTDPEVLKNCAGICWFLSRDDNGSRFLAGSGFLPIFFKMAQALSHYQNFIINTISNITLDKETHPYVIGCGSLFFDFLLHEFERRPYFFQLYKCIAGFVGAASDEHLQLLISTGLHTIILNNLILIPASTTWPVNSWQDWAISFAVSFSSIPSGAEALRKHGRLEVYYFFARESSIRGMQAIVVVANTLGKSEDLSFFLPFPLQVVNTLTDLFDVTVDYSEDRPLVRRFDQLGYGYGFIQLREISSALLNLSFQSSYARVMANNLKLLRSTLIALTAFVENSDDFQHEDSSEFDSVLHAGGGGKDIETFLNLLEMLLQLSFALMDDQAKLIAFINSLAGITDLLTSVLSLPSQRKVPIEALCLAESLLKHSYASFK